MNIGIIGAGYVGVTTGICLADLGHKIYLYDIDDEKITKLKNKSMPFFESGLQDLLTKSVSMKNLICTNSLKKLVENCSGCFICVGTPNNEQKQIDLSQIIDSVQSLCEEIRQLNKQQFNIIMRSTVVPYTTKNHVLPIINKILYGMDFGYSVIPEFLREGQALSDFMNPDKIVIGSIDEKSKNYAEAIFQLFGNNAKIINTNPETAELIKYVNNAFFSMLISFSNEVANIAEKIPNVDSFKVLEALVLDRRITSKENTKIITPGLKSYLIPGCGFGGSCFPKDVKALLQFAKSQNVDVPLIDAILKINDERVKKITTLTESLLGSLNNKKISILGLTFKPDTDDLRSSPSLQAIDYLKKKGATIHAYDPIISKRKSNSNFDFAISDNLENCLDDAHIAILFTNWSEFKQINEDFLKKLMKNPLIIDGRGYLNQNEFSRNVYYKIGFTQDQ